MLSSAQWFKGVQTQKCLDENGAMLANGGGLIVLDGTGNDPCTGLGRAIFRNIVASGKLKKK
ncbi:MAG: hypothetical protein PHC61_10280 [Chitinivibrionales bacterium]|nr:hypothetical protein [Chitinivibrionales bacterium]